MNAPDPGSTPTALDRLGDVLDRLGDVLDSIGPLAIAVSGGVDSLTLATAAHRRLGARAAMVHAVSPAVPSAATERTRAIAAAQGWELTVLDAREFEDARYLANPVDRCFYCKTNLYDSIARHWADRAITIVSGTNADDLGDYRPGLRAAAEHGVRHPFVEAGLDKEAVRSLARELGLGDVAELPASPCLSSRIETGIAIRPRTLSFVDRAEIAVRQRLGATTARCRVRATAIVIELDEAALGTLSPTDHHDVLTTVGALAIEAGIALPVELASYRMGSAFLHEPRA